MHGISYAYCSGINETKFGTYTIAAIHRQRAIGKTWPLSRGISQLRTRFSGRCRCGEVAVVEVF